MYENDEKNQFLLTEKEIKQKIFTFKQQNPQNPLYWRFSAAICDFWLKNASNLSLIVTFLM